MQNDYITLNALANELNSLLQNSKINKIYQPEKDEIIFETYTKNRERYNLLISVNPSNPRIHTTTYKKERPLAIKSFCSFLRKNLLNGTINNISLINNDRIFEIDITGKDELNYEKTFYLVFEHMGRYSNIFILDKDKIIIQSLLPIYADFALKNTKRKLAIGLKYESLEQNKCSITDIDGVLKILNKNISANDFFQEISGISRHLATEILLVYKEFKYNKEKIKDYLIELNKGTANKYYDPHLQLDHEIPKDFYIYAYKSRAHKELKKIKSINRAIDKVSTYKDKDIRLNNLTSMFLKRINQLIKKHEKTISENEKKLKKAEEKDKFKRYGDNILNNIYRIKKRDKYLICADYIDSLELKIPLNHTLSPTENAKKYYNRYNRLKRTEKIVSENQIKLKEELNYYFKIKNDIIMCATIDDFKDIKHQLSEIGIIKIKQKKKKKQTKYIPSYLKYTIDGFVVYLGKNSLQNNYVTFTLGDGNDIWVHAKNYHGSHAIIKVDNVKPDLETIKKVSSLTAFYSEAKNETKVTCDYTLKKFVKKHPANKLGLVIYKNHSSVSVTPRAYPEINN